MVCLLCRKIKKHCDWIAWNAAKAAEASSSTMNMVPGPSSVSESSSGHKLHPLVEVMKEIATKICTFHELYEVGHKVDKE